MTKILVLGSYEESLIKFRGPMLKEMVERGNQVIACAPAASWEIRNVLNEMGVNYQDVTIDRNGLSPVKDLRTICRLFVLLRKLKPDIFLGYTVKPVVYGSIVARLAGVPCIYSMITGLGYAFSKDGVKNRLISVIVRMLYRLSLKTNRKVFFQNQDDLTFFSNLGIVEDQEQCVLINGSGVDVDFYRPMPFPEKTCFLLIARLLKDKGIREYVKAARIVKRKHSNIDFHIVGWIDKNPGSISRDELRSWTREGIVKYLGKLSDVRPAIAASSVYVLPSYREGTSRTILEAMSMGRPVITTNAPGCRETVQNGINGFLVPVRDVDGLVKSIDKFINEPKLLANMGRESRRIAIRKYDVKKVNAEIFEAMGL